MIVSGRMLANLDHLFKVASGGFLECKVTIFSIHFINVTFGGDILRLCTYVSS